ncbi:MAG TPA: MFS transporter [Gemmatimonadaceae bacterium]|nr:MFS transporter [Gemmatimonadaceae bacterium]
MQTLIRPLTEERWRDTAPHTMNDPNIKAGRRQWIGVFVLALPCMLLAMDLTVLHLAVPALSVALKPTSTQLLWIVDIYGFLIAGSLITMGTLGDRIGRRKLLLWGAAAFGAASALAAFSSTPAMLIATRALLGVAGATLMPSTLGLIRNMFHDPSQRTVAITIWMNSFMLGSGLGPLLGGIMLEKFWWGSVFLLNVPIMALLLVLGPFLLPETRDPNAGKLDIASAALSLVAMLAIVYGIKRTTQDGLDTIAVVSLIAGILLGIVFIRRQGFLDHPLIDLRLFRVPAFSTSICTQLVALTAVAGIFFFTAQYLQLVVGLSPLQAGLWSLPWTLSGMTASMLTPALARRFPAAYVMGAALFLASSGMFLLLGIAYGGGFSLLIVSFVIIPAGINPTMTMTTDLIMGVAPPDRAGAASAISETSCELGLSLGMAILGSIGMASYRRLMSPDTLTGIPAAATTASRATLGGAREAARNLGGNAGAQLAAAAHDAFSHSLALVATLSGLLVVTMAVVAIVVLRNVPSRGSVPI